MEEPLPCFYTLLYTPATHLSYNIPTHHHFSEAMNDLNTPVTLASVENRPAPQI